MSWNGVKKYTNDAEIIAWCEEMGIENYTINSKGEIDVDGYVSLRYKYFKELPYKFGSVSGHFDLEGCENLISLKNCPNKIERYFNCCYCKKLDSLEGCPKEILGDFWCYDYKGRFTKEEIRSLCKTKDVFI